MAENIKKRLKQTINKFGWDIRRYRKDEKKTFPIDFEDEIIQTIGAVRSFTKTSPERLYGLINAVTYVNKHKISGDIVECGVWQGGSMMAVAHTLQRLNDDSRVLYLYDTFEGMTPPTEEDVIFYGERAVNILENCSRDDTNSYWCYSSLNTVKENMYSVGYKKENIKFVKGDVETSIPRTIPEKIALLRLDTDWYKSTRHELIHLFPKLVKGGVLIIDDYGWWKGSRKATDEYFQDNNTKILLQRLDHTGRIAVKL